MVAARERVARLPWTKIAWAVVACSCVAYVVALRVGPSCADQVAPWAGITFFAAFFWAVFQLERKDRR